MTATETPATEPLNAPIPAPIATGKRRVTLVVLSVLFALWVAALLWMYFATVYRQRHPAPRTAALPSSLGTVAAMASFDPTGARPECLAGGVYQ